MKKAILVLWGLVAIAFLMFIISIFTMRTQTTWQVFSIVAICSGIAFGGTIILLVVDFVRKKRDEAQ